MTQPGDIIKDEIRELRKGLGESVAEFGARFNRSGRTVEDWEQGRRAPDALIVTMMRQLAAHTT